MNIPSGMGPLSHTILSLDKKIFGKKLNKKLSKIGLDRSARVAGATISLDVAAEAANKTGTGQLVILSASIATKSALVATVGLAVAGKAIYEAVNNARASKFNPKNSNPKDTVSYFTDRSVYGKEDAPIPTDNDRKSFFEFYSKKENQEKLDELSKKLDDFHSTEGKKPFLRDMRNFLEENKYPEKYMPVYKKLLGNWSHQKSRYPHLFKGV